MATPTLQHVPEITPDIPLTLLTKRTIAYGMIKKVIDPNRAARASQAVLHIGDSLGFAPDHELVGCSPKLYYERIQDHERTQHLIEGSGALVVRCKVSTPDGVTNRGIWIDDEHRPLPEDSITFLGMIAEEGAAVEDTWEILHLSEESLALSHTPRREAFPFLATVLPFRTASEATTSAEQIAPQALPELQTVVGL